MKRGKLAKIVSPQIVRHNASTPHKNTQRSVSSLLTPNFPNERANT